MQECDKQHTKRDLACPRRMRNRDTIHSTTTSMAACSSCCSGVSHHAGTMPGIPSRRLPPPRTYALRCLRHPLKWGIEGNFKKANIAGYGTYRRQAAHKNIHQKCCSGDRRLCLGPVLVFPSIIDHRRSELFKHFTYTLEGNFLFRHVDGPSAVRIWPHPAC